MLSFISIAELVLIKSDGDKQVQGGIIAALSSGVYSRNIGEPTPYLVKQIEDLKAWRDIEHCHQIVVEFAESLIEMTEQDIEKQLHRKMKNFLKGKNGKFNARNQPPSENWRLCCKQENSKFCRVNRARC